MWACPPHSLWFRETFGEYLCPLCLFNFPARLGGWGGSSYKTQQGGWERSTLHDQGACRFLEVEKYSDGEKGKSYSDLPHLHFCGKTVPWERRSQKDQETHVN